MPYPWSMQYALQRRLLCLVSHSILILTLHSLNYKWRIFCYPTSRVHGRCLENTNFFIVLFYRSLPMDAYFVLDYSLYEWSISHECYPSLTTVSYPTNRIPYDCFVPHEFVSFTSVRLNAFHCECSYLYECVFLFPFRNAFYSAKMFPCEMRSTQRKCSLANGLSCGSWRHRTIHTTFSYSWRRPSLRAAYLYKRLCVSLLRACGFPMHMQLYIL